VEKQDLKLFLSTTSCLTFLEPGEVDEPEVGVGSEFEEAEDEAVGETDLVVAVERQAEIVVVESVLQRYDVVHPQHTRRPRRHRPLDRLQIDAIYV